MSSHPHRSRWLTIALCLVVVEGISADTIEEYVGRVAPLIDPVRLATLTEKGANPRVQKYTVWLEIARRDGVNPTNVIDGALVSVGMTKGPPQKLRKQ